MAITEKRKQSIAFVPYATGFNQFVQDLSRPGDTKEKITSTIGTRKGGLNGSDRPRRGRSALRSSNSEAVVKEMLAMS